jgi:hypothetical protein
LKKRAVGTLLVLIFMLAACGPGAITTTSTKATTTSPKTTVQTTAAPAPVATTKPVEKPIYGGTLNLVMISDITSWDYGLTFC